MKDKMLHYLIILKFIVALIALIPILIIARLTGYGED